MEWPAAVRTLWLHVSSFDKLAESVLQAKPKERAAMYARVADADRLFKAIYSAYRQRIENIVGNALEDDLNIATELLSLVAVPLVKRPQRRGQKGGKLIADLRSNSIQGIEIQWQLVRGRLRQHAETLRRAMSEAPTAPTDKDWSPAKTKKEWRKLFDISASTFRRWRENGKIRCKEVTGQRIAIHNADVQLIADSKRTGTRA